MSQSRKKFLFCFSAALILFLPPLRRCAMAAILALLTAAVAARPIQFLENHRLPRWLGVTVVLGGAAAALAALLVCAAERLCGAVGSLADLFPDFPALFQHLIALAQAVPGPVGQVSVRLLTSLSEQSAQLPARLTAYGARMSARMLATLPDKLFFLLIGLLASFYAALDWPALRRRLLYLVPDDWSRHCYAGLRSLRRGAAGWLKAQGKLVLIQFAVLASGLLLLRIRGAVLAGALIALADALPLFGCGVILLPWALLVWLEGRGTQAAGLLLLWLAVWLLRTVLEPRFVGQQAGADPFFTLLAMYLGLLSFGFWGLIAAPVVLAAGTQLAAGRADSRVP